MIYEATTLEELDFDLEIDLDALILVGDGEFEDTEREQAKIRYRRGSEIIGYYFDLGFEGIEVDNEFNTLTEEFDGFTFGFGGNGSYRFTPDEDVSPLLLYGLGLGFGYGETDREIVTDPSLSDPLILESSIAYLQILGEVGGGVDLFGAQVAAGASFLSMYGRLTTDVETTIEGLPIDFEEEFDFDGTNWGPFIQIGYRGEEVPINASLRFLFGDYRGLVASLGIHF